MRCLDIKNKKNRLLVSVLGTVIYIIYFASYYESLLFSDIAFHTDFETFPLILRGLFAVFFCWLLYFVMSFVVNLSSPRRSFYLRWLRSAGLYALLMTTFLLLLYPGNWVWDEFHILHGLRTGDINMWQGYMTNLYYGFCLLLYPSGITIILFQLAFLSMVVGYVYSRLYEIIDRMALVVFLPFLLIPVIMNNLYPLRLTMYAYVEVIFIFKLILLWYSKKTTLHAVDLLSFGVMIAILVYWRSEGICYLLTVPILLYKAGVHKGLISRKKRLQTLFLCVLLLSPIVGATVLQAKYNNPRYTLVTFINPLSTMLQHPYDEVSAEELNSIDKNIDIDIIKKYPSYDEVPAYWTEPSKVIINDSQIAVNSVGKSFLIFSVRNLDDFISNRWQVFLSTNSLTDTPPYVARGKRILSNVSETDVTTTFYTENKLSKPLHKELSANISRGLLMITHEGETTLLGKLVWNFIPVLFFISVIFIHAFVKRRTGWVIATGLLLLKAGIIFLTAPANYFMYYFPFYLTGMLVIVLYCCAYLRLKRI